MVSQRIISKRWFRTNDALMLESTYNGFSFPMHFHEAFVCEVISKGNQRFSCKGIKDAKLSPGMLTLVNPGVVHTGGNYDDGELVCNTIYIGPAEWEKIIGESAGYKPQCSDYRFKHTIAEDSKLANDIWLLSGIPDLPENDIFAKEIYQGIMIHLLQHYMDADPSKKENANKYSAAISRSIEYINDNINSKLLLEDIARAAFLSPFHLLRVFKQIIGLTLHKYIVALRIERVKPLLLQNSGSIQHTVRPVGFLSPAHFSRVFRKMTGITPTEYVSMFKK